LFLSLKIHRSCSYSTWKTPFLAQKPSCL
jgi:hypothetical protein